MEQHRKWCEKEKKELGLKNTKCNDTGMGRVYSNEKNGERSDDGIAVR